MSGGVTATKQGHLSHEATKAIAPVEDIRDKGESAPRYHPVAKSAAKVMKPMAK